MKRTLAVAVTVAALAAPAAAQAATAPAGKYPCFSSYGGRVTFSSTLYVKSNGRYDVNRRQRGVFSIGRAGKVTFRSGAYKGLQASYRVSSVYAFKIRFPLDSRSIGYATLTCSKPRSK